MCELVIALHKIMAEEKRRSKRSRKPPDRYNDAIEKPEVLEQLKRHCRREAKEHTDKAEAVRRPLVLPLLYKYKQSAAAAAIALCGSLSQLLKEDPKLIKRTILRFCFGDGWKRTVQSLKEEKIAIQLNCPHYCEEYGRFAAVDEGELVFAAHDRYGIGVVAMDLETGMVTTLVDICGDDCDDDINFSDMGRTVWCAKMRVNNTQDSTTKTAVFIHHQDNIITLHIGMKTMLCGWIDGAIAMRKTTDGHLVCLIHEESIFKLSSFEIAIRTDGCCFDLKHTIDTPAYILHLRHYKKSGQLQVFTLGNDVVVYNETSGDHGIQHYFYQNAHTLIEMTNSPRMFEPFTLVEHYLPNLPKNELTVTHIMFGHCVDDPRKRQHGGSYKCFGMAQFFDGGKIVSTYIFPDITDIDGLSCNDKILAITRRNFVWLCELPKIETTTPVTIPHSKLTQNCGFPLSSVFAINFNKKILVLADDSTVCTVDEDGDDDADFSWYHNQYMCCNGVLLEPKVFCDRRHTIIKLLPSGCVCVLNNGQVDLWY